MSTYKRAQQTARYIVRHHSRVPVITDARARERDVGVLEDTPYGTIEALAKKRRIPVLHFRPRGGESLHDVRVRVLGFMREARKRHAGKSVLLVTHGGVIRVILRRVLKVSREKLEEYPMKNTAVSLLEFRGAEVRAHYINRLDHLKNVSAGSLIKKRARNAKAGSR